MAATETAGLSPMPIQRHHGRVVEHWRVSNVCRGGFALSSQVLMQLMLSTAAERRPGRGKICNQSQQHRINELSILMAALTCRVATHQLLTRSR